MKVGSIMLEKMIAILIAKLIFDLSMFLFKSLPSSILLDCSLIEGMIVVAKDPINVEGIMTSGNVMPIMMPYSDSASVEE